SMMVRVTGSSSWACSVAVSAIVTIGSSRWCVSVPRSSAFNKTGRMTWIVVRCRASCQTSSVGLTPELLRRQPRSLRERLELGPHHRRVDALGALTLGEPAVRAGDDVLPAHQLCKPNDPVRDQARVLHRGDM